MIALLTLTASCSKEAPECFCEYEIEHTDISATRFSGVYDGTCREYIARSKERVTILIDKGNGIYEVAGVNGVVEVRIITKQKCK